MGAKARKRADDCAATAPLRELLPRVLEVEVFLYGRHGAQWPVPENMVGKILSDLKWLQHPHFLGGAFGIFVLYISFSRLTILFWLMVSTHLKNMSQNGNLPQVSR